MTIIGLRYSDRPELWDQITHLSSEVWPEYNLHGDVLNRFWDGLYDRFPDYQFILYDDTSETVLAEGHTIPVTWNRMLEDLGPGIDASVAAGFELQSCGGEPNTLCALAAEIAPQYRNRRLATMILDQMASIGRSAGLTALIAPVRPNWKERYPLTPIERYVHWVGPTASRSIPGFASTSDLGQPSDPPLPSQCESPVR